MLRITKHKIVVEGRRHPQIVSSLSDWGDTMLEFIVITINNKEDRTVKENTYHQCAHFIPL